MRAIEEVKGHQGESEEAGVVWDSPRESEEDGAGGEGTKVMTCLLKCIQDSGVPRKAEELAAMATKTRLAGTEADDLACCQERMLEYKSRESGRERVVGRSWQCWWLESRMGGKPKSSKRRNTFAYSRLRCLEPGGRLEREWSG